MRKFVLSLVAVAMVVAFSGCDSSSTPPKDTKPAPTSTGTGTH